MKRFFRQMTVYALLALMIIGFVYMSPAALASEADEAAARASELASEADEAAARASDDAATNGDNGSGQEPSQPQAPSSLYLAFEHWEENGYPDDIGGVYSIDGSQFSAALLVVDPTQERIAELRGLYGEGLVITPCKYSHNELMQVQNEIAELMIQSSGIYGCGNGWTVTDDVVHGFGESSKELRVTVTVDESMFDHYSKEFSFRYGDMVHVEIGGPFYAQSAADGNSINSDPYIVNFWPLAIGAAFLLGTLAYIIWLRLSNSPAMQTVSGGVISKGTILTNKQVAAAIKESGSVPSDKLLGSIMEQIGNVKPRV